MKIKIFGTPNMLVKQRQRKPYSLEIIFKPLFRFDNNGEFITDDINIIKKIQTKSKFKYEEILDEKENNTQEVKDKFEVYNTNTKKVGAKKNASRIC